jgi:nucleoid-associated protein YgaU
MRRAFTITAATVALFASNVAWANPQENPVRLPMTLSEVVAPQQVTVEQGDHLWKISERHLVATQADSAIAPYWHRVVELNLPTLRSGNPDLIYPGELVTLPDVGSKNG